MSSALVNAEILIQDAASLLASVVKVKMCPPHSCDWHAKQAADSIAFIRERCDAIEAELAASVAKEAA